METIGILIFVIFTFEGTLRTSHGVRLELTLLLSLLVSSLTRTKLLLTWRFDFGFYLSNNIRFVHLSRTSLWSCCSLLFRVVPRRSSSLPQAKTLPCLLSVSTSMNTSLILTLFPTLVAPLTALLLLPRYIIYFYFQPINLCNLFWTLNFRLNHFS